MKSNQYYFALLQRRKLCLEFLHNLLTNFILGLLLLNITEGGQRSAGHLLVQIV